MECKSKDELLLMSVQRISFLTLNEKIKLLKKLDSFNALALMSLEDMISFCGRNLSRIKWNGKENLRYAENELRLLRAKRIAYVLYSDADYPALLREVPDAPFMLFYRGNLLGLSGRTVSVVGTRRVSSEGKSAAIDFAMSAALDGCSVVSGLAYGVDSAAHYGAVSAYYDSLVNNKLCAGKTVAVLPCGCESVTPRSNVRLAEQILESGGCIVSEYAPGTPAENWRFVHRNRIIAALSPATVVIQAPAGSGALITAQFALEYNRDVMFHHVAFGTEYECIRKHFDANLKFHFSRGEVSKAKLENTPECYLEAGAPVIDNYADYCKCLTEMPGIRSVKTEQLELF